MPRVFPIVSFCVVGVFGHLMAATSEPRLERISYDSPATGAERDYLVYLPGGYDEHGDWPVILFLHGNGERGDAKGELDYVLCHGPLYEAWVQKMDLPFIIISPQLPMYGQGDVDYIRDRTPAQIPQRLAEGVPARGERFDWDTPMGGELAEGSPFPPEGRVEGWFRLEEDLLLMLDHAVTELKGDADRVYLTGLSYGGYGTWHMGAKYSERFAAMVPVVGHGHVAHAEPLAATRMPIWQWAGGRDTIVPVRHFYPVMNELERLGHRDIRFTIEADMGHDAWVRAYQSEALYDWLLEHRLSDRSAVAAED